ncbi:hypothetical protein ACWCOT_23390 [Nonomuraea bangladeshensis]
MRAKRAVKVVAQIAAGAGLLMFWVNFILAAPLALIGLVLALIETRRNAGRTSIYSRWVTAICLVVLVAVAIRWYLSSPMEYVINPAPRPGDPIPEPAN